MGVYTCSVHVSVASTRKAWKRSSAMKVNRSTVSMCASRRRIHDTDLLLSCRTCTDNRALNKIENLRGQWRTQLTHMKQITYLARQISVRAELRRDVVRRGGIEVGTRVEPHVALAYAPCAPRSGCLHRLAARQHCNTRCIITLLV